MPQLLRRIVRSTYFTLVNLGIGALNTISAVKRHNWEACIAWMCVCLSWVVIALMERRQYFATQRED